MVLNQPAIFILAVILVWLVAVTVWLARTAGHYSRLTGRTGKTELRSVLEQLLREQADSDAQIKKVEGALQDLSQDVGTHVQKVGVVRFNPYAETGGDQSFALALLDRNDAGVVLLSLHGRENTRIYVKPVKEGKSRYELSKEEKQAIDQARK